MTSENPDNAGTADEGWLGEALNATGGPLTHAERAWADSVLNSTDRVAFSDDTRHALDQNADALTPDPAGENTSRDSLDALADFQAAVAEGIRRTGFTGSLVDSLLADRAADPSATLTVDQRDQPAVDPDPLKPDPDDVVQPGTDN